MVGGADEADFESSPGISDSVPPVAERPAIGQMHRYPETGPLPEPEKPSVDPCPTPLAHAVFPASTYPEEKVPSSRELLLDDRVERLLAENLLLLKERAELRAIADRRAERCNELLGEARKAKRLARAAIRESDARAGIGTDLHDSPALAELRAWAAETL